MEHTHMCNDAGWWGGGPYPGHWGPSGAVLGPSRHPSVCDQVIRGHPKALTPGPARALPCPNAPAPPALPGPPAIEAPLGLSRSSLSVDRHVVTTRGTDGPAGADALVITLSWRWELRP